MKIALLVGVDYYEHGQPLWGCVNDANNVKTMLERNGDGSVNFDCKLQTAPNKNQQITRAELKDNIKKLFTTEAHIALFYFAGHGHIETTGGYLLTSDAKRGDEGVSLSEILILANKSPAANKVIILDSCHSGIAGTAPSDDQLATLSDGLTVLTASTKDQYASEVDGSGVFTNLFIDALGGSAANITGFITPGSIYAHIDQSLGGWEQRPIFKTNVKQFISLRSVQSSIPLDELRMISKLFSSVDFEFKLDPTFEPEMKGRDDGMPGPIIENTRTFAILQKFNRLNLVVPIGATHMWNAAMEYKSCKLTVLGEHYRRLAAKGRI